MEKSPRFLDLYHAGKVAAGDIDSYIEQWHEGSSHVSLHVHLGLTWAEYGTWAATETLPTEVGHSIQGRQDVVFAVFTGDEPGNTTLLRTHGPLRCRPACPIHWPSDHPRAAWPLGWDAARGIVTRVCRHGEHHPDPDDQQVRLHSDLAEHSCDGCCRPTMDGDFYEEDEPVEQLLTAFERGRKGITARPA